MLVACDDDIIPGYVDVGRVLGGTEEADGIECHLKLGACADERATHRLYLLVHSVSVHVCGREVYV